MKWGKGATSFGRANSMSASRERQTTTCTTARGNHLRSMRLRVSAQSSRSHHAFLGLGHSAEPGSTHDTVGTASTIYIYLSPYTPVSSRFVEAVYILRVISTMTLPLNPKKSVFEHPIKWNERRARRMAHSSTRPMLQRANDDSGSYSVVEILQSESCSPTIILVDSIVNKTRSDSERKVKQTEDRKYNHVELLTKDDGGQHAYSDNHQYVTPYRNTYPYDDRRL